MDVTIFHNPRCGTSRNTLALIRATGIEPRVVEYLQTPPTRAELQQMIGRAGLSVREAVRSKEPLFDELGLDNAVANNAVADNAVADNAFADNADAGNGDDSANAGAADDALLDAMVAHPVLINRPFVVTSKGVRLCRPAELVHDIL